MKKILLPKESRACILRELHSTHLSTEMMKNIFHGRFFWSKINDDIERIYHECEGCQREAASKVKKKRCEVIPPDLTQVAPAESISIDYAVYNNQDIMVIKDWSTGYISAGPIDS